MANKKFKKPLLLQEEFTAGEISKPGQTTAPAVKTDSTTVGTQQTSAKSGEEVRAEIVQDVDTILTNLEQLSKQITESIDAIIEEVFNEDVNLELNENFRLENSLILIDILSSTGLQIKADPGITLIYLGFLFLMISTLISYITYSQIWIVKDKQKIFIGGNTTRAAFEFELEFLKLIK